MAHLLSHSLRFKEVERLYIFMLMNEQILLPRINNITITFKLREEK